MTTSEIADRLVDFCRKGDFEGAQKDLYADNAISIEPMASPDFEKETKGLQAILEKGHKFKLMIDKRHDLKISDPLVSSNSFAFMLTMDMTMKEQKRATWTELCVYAVKEGKIVSEQFFM